MMKVKVLAGVVFCALSLTRAVCAQNRYFLSQVANGGSFRTTFILFNNNDTAVTAALRLTDDSAGPLPVTIPGLGTGSQFTLSLDPGATRFLQTEDRRLWKSRDRSGHGNRHCQNRSLGHF